MKWLLRPMPILMFGVIGVGIVLDLIVHEWNLAFWKAMTLFYYGLWLGVGHQLEALNDSLKALPKDLRRYRSP